MSDELVGVIVPTYNRAYCLPRAVNSALAQSHLNVEVLVVDDGSTDDTRALIERLYGGESRVRYLPQENQGVSAARNTGLAHVRGDFVALLDSDDYWYPWKLEVQLAALRRLPDVGMVWTDMEAIDPAGNVIDPKYLTTMYDAFRRFPEDKLFAHRYALRDFAPELGAVAQDASVYVGDIFSQMIAGSFVHTSTVLLRRERLEQVGLFNTELKFAGEDFDFHLRTCRVGDVALINLSSIQYQRGMADRLTRDEHKVHMALNYLRAITPFIERERHRIRLSDETIRDILAQAHLWAGEAALNGGDYDLAQRHLWNSLQQKWAQPRGAALWLMASLPCALENSLRRGYRSIKTRLLGAY